MSRSYYTYIVSNKHRTTFYIGMTNNIVRRIFEHKTGTGSVFTSRYNLKYLMYYEEYGQVMLSIKREKQLKRWRREWKLNLIKASNPEMLDLAADWYDQRDIDDYVKG